MHGQPPCLAFTFTFCCCCCFVLFCFSPPPNSLPFYLLLQPLLSLGPARSGPARSGPSFFSFLFKTEAFLHPKLSWNSAWLSTALNSHFSCPYLQSMGNYFIYYCNRRNCSRAYQAYSNNFIFCFHERLLFIKNFVRYNYSLKKEKIQDYKTLKKF